MGLAHDVIDVALLVGGLAQAHGARHVGVIVAHHTAVVHHDHVAALDLARARLGVRVGAVGAARDDRAERQAVAAVGEHVVLQLGANLLLGLARLDVAADVAEGGVGNLLGGAHERDLLGVLDGTEPHEVAVQARGERGRGVGGEARLEGVVEGQRGGVLHGHHAGMRVADVLGGPVGGVDDVLVDLPGGVGAEALDEGVVVARVGVEEEVVGRDEGCVGDLVVEGALGAGEPAQVGVVAQDHGVVAPLPHDGAQPLDALCVGLLVCHGVPFCRKRIQHASRLWRGLFARGLPGRCAPAEKPPLQAPHATTADGVALVRKRGAPGRGGLAGAARGRGAGLLDAGWGEG